MLWTFKNNIGVFKTAEAFKMVDELFNWQKCI